MKQRTFQETRKTKFYAISSLGFNFIERFIKINKYGVVFRGGIYHGEFDRGQFSAGEFDDKG